MQKIIQLFFILFIFQNLMIGGPKEFDHLFDQANEAYQKGNFKEALSQYEYIVNHGYENGQLYYNLGNCYFKINQIGLSILNYEKATILLPNDENIKFNLKLANLKIKDRIEVPPEFFLFTLHKKIINLFSSQQWGFGMTFFGFLSALFFSLIKNIDHGRFYNTMKQILKISIILTIMCAYPTTQRYRLEYLDKKGIVLTGEVKILAAPEETSTNLFQVHEGTKFTILDSDGIWYKIKLIDGKQGWIPQQTCKKI